MTDASAWPEPPSTYAPRAKPNAPVREELRARAHVDLAAVTKNNIGQVRKLNQVLFPVSYSGKVYEEVLSDDVRPLCKLALFNDLAVGNVCCRLEPEADSGATRVYIATLGVLNAYRHLGIGTLLLKHVLATAAPGSTYAGHPVSAVYLHVQTSNADARQFYEHFGFRVVGEIPQYYTQIEPTSAWVLELKA